MKNKYDIIIIGSGLGGLQNGVILSRKGYKVLVLEKNHQFGGSLQSFKRSGVNFSTGLHYIGGMDKGQTLHKILSYFNLNQDINYKRLDSNGFDVFNIGGTEYHFPIGFNNFKKQMYEYFPEEKQAINKYVNEIINVVESQDIYSLNNIKETTNKENKYLRLNAWEHICSLTSNPKLQQVLSALNFVYAGVKSNSPFYIHALLNYHFISSSYRVVGSTNNIVNKLLNQIIENGGLALAKAEVDEILTENKTVTGVKIKDGTVFHAKYIISDVHPATTLNLVQQGVVKKAFSNRIKNKENTISAFAVHINLKKNTFKYLNHNYNYYKRGDVWYASYYSEDNWPEHYFLHSNVPENESEFTTGIELLTHMSFDEVEKWKNLPTNKRGKEYIDFKNKKAIALINLASKQFPNLKDSIQSFTVSTPLTYHSYLGTPRGSMYGTLRDNNNPIGSYISPRTQIKNLFFTGQNINLHGILGVSLSSILTCGEFVGVNNIINEINENYQKK